MPNIKSAAKHMRKSRLQNVRNRAAKSELKTLARKVVDLAQSGNVADAEKQFRVVGKRLDQAASKKIIHPNTASRKKSRLQHTIVAAKKKS